MKEKIKKQKSSGTFIEKLTTVLGKIGDQRHLAVLRDSFATYLPFLIIGAVGMLFITIIFGGWGSDQNSLLGLISKISTGSFELTGNFRSVADGAEKMFGILSTATIDSISIYVVIFIGWYLTKTRVEESDFMESAPIAIAMSLFAFLAVTELNPDWFGANGLLPGMLIAIGTTELYCYLQKIKKLHITMPASVPPAVARAFSKLAAIVITGLALAAINYIFVIICKYGAWDISEKKAVSGALADITAQDASITASTDFSKLTDAQLGNIFAVIGEGSIDDSSKMSASLSHDTVVFNFTQIKYHHGDYGIVGTIYLLFTAPLMSVVGSTSGGLGLALLYVMLVGFLWFLGLHGANMTAGIFLPLWLSAQAYNIADIQAGVDPEYVFAQPFFEAFIWVGGGMGTLMLVTATFIFSKRQEEKEIAKFAVVPGIFNINEPVVFGYPIVLNWRYFVPFVFVMPIQVIITWLFMGPMGFVEKPSVSMPWTTPPLIGNLIVTRFDYKSLLPAVINLGVAFAIYVPFILWGNKSLKVEQKLSLAK